MTQFPGVTRQHRSWPSPSSWSPALLLPTSSSVHTTMQPCWNQSNAFICSTTREIRRRPDHPRLFPRPPCRQRPDAGPASKLLWLQAFIIFMIQRPPSPMSWPPLYQAGRGRLTAVRDTLSARLPTCPCSHVLLWPPSPATSAGTLLTPFPVAHCGGGWGPFLPQIWSAFVP